MQNFPHRYTALANAEARGDVELTSANLPKFFSASPPEFDGPGDRWCPERLFVAAVGDCFILTFRSIARRSRLPWTSLRCEVTGTLDRVERVTQFTAFDVHADLEVPAGTNIDLARSTLEKAEHHCLIANSLKGVIRLVPTVNVAAEPVGELTEV